MSAGYYNTTNNTNFKVRDPVSRLNNEIIAINATLDGIHPGGRTYFFNGEEQQTWRIDQLVDFLPGYTGALLMSHYSSLEQQTKTVTVPTKDFKFVVWGTDPRQDLLGPNCTEANWECHLYNQTTSTHLSVGMIPLLVSLQDSTWSASYLWDYFYPVKIEPQTSDLVTETTFKNLVGTIQARNPTSQIYVVLAFYNDNTVDENITLYFGGPRELNTRSRLETNWLPNPQPPMMTWTYGYYSSGASDFNSYLLNPLQGAFFSDYDTDPNPMYKLYGYDIHVSLRTFNNANIWGYYYSGDLTYLKISDITEPGNALLGYIDGYDLDPTTPNPYTVYKGFNYIYKNNWGDDPSINRLIIYSLTGGNNSGIVEDIYSYYDDDTNNDYWTFETYDTNNPDTLIYTAIYGGLIDTPLSAKQIDDYFKSFVDNVIYNGSSTVPDVTTMQSNFNANFNRLTAVLPTLVSDFQFLTYENCPIFGGSGLNFRPNIAFGRGYFPANGYFNPVYNAGSGYILGEVVTVSGTDLGGTSPANDAIITITGLDGLGGVTTYSVTGTPKYLQYQNNIFDGGLDQYDNGNYMQTNYSGISYGDGSVQNGLFGGSSTTIVDYNNSIFVCFNRDCYNTSYFEVYGGLGSDGYGNYEVGNINQSMYMYVLDGDNYGAYGNIVPGHLYSIEFSSHLSAFSATNKTGAGSLKQRAINRSQLLREGKLDASKLRLTPKRQPTPLTAKQQRKLAYLAKQPSQAQAQSQPVKLKRSVKKQNASSVKSLNDQVITVSKNVSLRESLNPVDPNTFAQTVKSLFFNGLKKN